MFHVITGRFVEDEAETLEEAHELCLGCGLYYWTNPDGTVPDTESGESFKPGQTWYAYRDEQEAKADPHHAHPGAVVRWVADA